MVDVSHESAAQTTIRLQGVMAQVRLRVMPGFWCFQEFALHRFPAAVSEHALALVHDEEVWSQLVPCDAESGELFGVFSLHFPAGVDNSGFVGWLATHLKRRFGTGVFVVCGSNLRCGGVYDYWGVPASLAGAVMDEVLALVRPSARPA